MEAVLEKSFVTDAMKHKYLQLLKLKFEQLDLL
jgi:hypothetical protein